MGVDKHYTLFHQRRHTQGVTRIVGKREEGRHVWNEATVEREAIGDGRHAEFTYAKKHVVAAAGVAHRFGTRPPGEVRSREISRTTYQFRQARRQRFDGVLRGFARGDGFGPGVNLRQHFRRVIFPVARQLARKSPLQFCRQIRMLFRIARELFVPRGFLRRATPTCIPARVHRFGNFKRRIFPAERHARRGNFFRAQWSAVCATGVGFFRRAFTDDGFAADQYRLRGFSLRLLDRRIHGVSVVTIHIANHTPTVGLETLWRVISKPLFYVMFFRIYRNAVIVVERDQFAQPQGAGQRTHFV